MRLLLEDLHRAIQPAQLIHQPVLLGLSAHPDASLGQRLNLIERLFAALGYVADKGPVERVDLAGKFLPFGIAERASMRNRCRRTGRA